MPLEQLLFLAIEAALRAGTAILDVYNSDFTVSHKEDKSPLTLADKNAHEIIQKILSASSIPVLSEEGRDVPYSERSRWEELWIVDPLDGTKEFIKRNGDFTVNIALIRNGAPVAGVIYQPTADRLYAGMEGMGAFCVHEAQQAVNNPAAFPFLSKAEKLPAFTPEVYTVVASRSHLSPETTAYIEQEKETHKQMAFLSAGSSLKLCMIAEGSAHVYPRFAPTMEWDVAAGHAIIKAAGKNVFCHKTGEELHYNKPDLHNDWFIAK